jgi:hypothetical protein
MWIGWIRIRIRIRNTVRSPGRGREKEPANGRESNGRADHRTRRVDDRTVVVLHQRDEVRLLAPGLAIKNPPKKTKKTQLKKPTKKCFLFFVFFGFI